MDGWIDHLPCIFRLKSVHSCIQIHILRMHTTYYGVVAKVLALQFLSDCWPILSLLTLCIVYSGDFQQENKFRKYGLYSSVGYITHTSDKLLAYTREL